MWFGAVVPLKSGCNGSVSFWTLWRSVYTAVLWQPPQLGWLAVHGVCPQPHAEARGLASHRAQCPRKGSWFPLPCVCVLGGWVVAVAVENAFLRAMLIHAFLGPILVWKAFMGTIFVWKPTGIFVRSMIDPCIVFLGPMLA